MSPVHTRSKSSGRERPAATVKQRVDKRRATLRAQGLRPIQIWVPDTRAPGFAEEATRQARLLVDWERTPRAQAEIAEWDSIAADPWEGL